MKSSELVRLLKEMDGLW